MKNIFWLPLIASLLMVACTDKELEEKINPCDGEEVNFSVSADDGKGRTLYGDEAADGKSVVVNWVKGDKVMVYGTDCANKSAEYKVPDSAHGQNYAGKLEKTGAAGVQWGPAVTSDFYSVYPSNSSIEPYETVGEGENKKITSVKVTTEIRRNQNVSFTFNKEETKWIGTHYNDDSSNPTMTDAVMYAVTTDAKANANNGAVNLKYVPYSNVFRITFNGFDIQLKEDELSGSVDNVAYVRQITVTAPFAISGDFPMIIGRDGKVEVDQNSIKQSIEKEEADGNVSPRKSVVIKPDFLPLASKQSVQFDVFTIPEAYEFYFNEESPEKSNYFIITVETTLGSFTYHLKPKNEGANKVVAGQMHKVTIPQKTIEHTVTIPMDSWMRYIPRNVYLSELSVPGAWYCMDSKYQGSIGINSDTDNDGIDDGLMALYKSGVRAFNIDCRITRDEFRDFAIGSNPWKDSHYEAGNYHFACAGTETPTTVTAYVQMKEGVHVLKAVQDIVKLANSNPYEIVAIIFTFAERPCTESGGTSNKVYGTTNPAYITAELKKVLEDKNIAPYIYKNINSFTTVGDLLTKEDGAEFPRNVLVKINHSNNEFYSNYSMPDGIMASYGSMALESEGWGNGYIKSITALTPDYYSLMQCYPIYNGTTTNGMNYYYCQAQKTFNSGGTPTIDQRKNAISNVLGEARKIYISSEHNALFQLGIGGTLDGSDQLAITKSLNAYVRTQIETMLSSPDELSPLGFVLMNHCLDKTYGIPLVNDIFKFNTKFTLNRDNTKDEWPDNCGGNAFDELYGSEW